MSDLDEVQNQEASTEELGSKEKEAEKEQPEKEAGAEDTEVKAPEPLDEKKIQQMIAEATAKAVKEAKELGKRELQSQQDRNKAELARATRRAQIAERSLDAARTQISGLDPDAAKEIELAQLRAEREGMSMAEREELAAKQQEEFHKQFTGSLTQFITGLGIDPEDKRIDWAADAQNYLEAQRRVLESVQEIQKSNLSAKEAEFEQRLKTLEEKTKEASTEANSVETGTPAGVTSMSEADFKKKFGAGELPVTKENVARYNKITAQY